MPRKRITEVFPFLLPLRKWQRKKLFYLKNFDYPEKPLKYKHIRRISD